MLEQKILVDRRKDDLLEQDRGLYMTNDNHSKRVSRCLQVMSLNKIRMREIIKK